MIVWGSKGEVSVLEAHEHKHCPVCEKERTFLVQLHYKVHHIWYLFKWVTSKQYVKVCEVCQRGEKLATKAVEETLGKPAIPFMSRWSWAFLVAVIVGIGVFGSIADSNRSTQVQTLVATPMKNDIYIANVASLLKSPESSSMYGVLRVRNVDGDKIEFDAPRVTYNKLKGVTKDMSSGKASASDYFEGTIVFTKDEIAGLQKAGNIHSIERH